MLDLDERINKIIAEGNAAANTLEAYKQDIKHFWSWAYITRQIDTKYPIPPDLIEAYILENVEGFDAQTNKMMIEFGYKAKPGKLSIATLRRRIDALIWKHKCERFENPVNPERMKLIFRSARRAESKAGRVIKKSLPITQDILERLIKSIKPDTLIGKRNRAILTFGFYTGGRRRAEIASAEYRFLSELRGGYTYLLSRSKTDQLGRGSIKPLSRKRAYPMKAWLKASCITSGFLFRRIMNGRVNRRPISGQLVNNIIKDHIEAIGLDPVEYSAHGLRRGFVTEAARRGVSVWDIMQLTGHRDMRTVQGYFEQGKVENNPGGRL